MPRTTPLRAVGPDEKRSVKASTILEAAQAGDRLAELKAMRLRLAKALDDPKCPPRDMAALSRRQLEIGREIEVLQAEANQEEARDAARQAQGRRSFDAAAL